MFKPIKRNGVTAVGMGRDLLGRNLYPVFCFITDDLLIDTGTIFCAGQLVEFVEGRKIIKIVNTHHHEDHIGNNAAIAQITGAEIRINRKGLPFLEDPARMKLKPYQRFFWGLPQPSVGGPLGQSVQTANGRLEVIETPGHCPDHVCLFDRSRGNLFTGDIFASSRIKYFRADEDYFTILESLKTLAGLDFSTLFCGLKGPVADGHEAIVKKIEFMTELAERAEQLQRRGLSRARITKKLLGKEGLTTILTGGHYSKRNAIDSILDRRPVTPPPAG